VNLEFIEWDIARGMPNRSADKSGRLKTSKDHILAEGGLKLRASKQSKSVFRVKRTPILRGCSNIPL
jgi:hypothetical protein